MRVIVDTNILISALLIGDSSSARLLEYWRQGTFTLITAEAQIEELTRVMRYPKIRTRVAPALGNPLIEEMQDLAIFMHALPFVERSSDPTDNYLLAMAEAGGADYLVSGDKRHVLALHEHAGTRIVTLRDFIAQLDQP